jgi:proline dehydrogenase
MEYNKKIFNHINNQQKKPVIYNTYQTYLKRTNDVIEKDLEHAKQYNYIFAIKLVRGAYMYSENKRYQNNKISTKSNQLFLSKNEVDLTYNKILEKLIKLISINNNNTQIYLLIATHNRMSIMYALEQMEKYKMENSHSCIHFAQIKGMCDNLTFALGLHNYNVSKLIVYGSFVDVLPWLIRRIEENHVRKIFTIYISLIFIQILLFIIIIMYDYYFIDLLFSTLLLFIIVIIIP